MSDNLYGERIELIIRDFSGAKIDNFRWSLNDKRTENKIHSIIQNKYGIFRNVGNKNNDLGWLKKHDTF